MRHLCAIFIDTQRVFNKIQNRSAGNALHERTASTARSGQVKSLYSWQFAGLSGVADFAYVGTRTSGI